MLEANNMRQRGTTRGGRAQRWYKFGRLVLCRGAHTSWPVFGRWNEMLLLQLLLLQLLLQLLLLLLLLFLLLK